MAKRKKSRRRAPKTTSILNVLESLTYATILTEGVAGTSVFGLITGATDIGQGTGETFGGITTYSNPVGVGSLSLGDIISEPSIAISTMTQNFNNNWQGMAVQSFLVSLTFKFGRRLMRRPINNINRNIMKPLGMGVRV